MARKLPYIKRTSKKQLQEIAKILIIAPQAEKQLNKAYKLPRLQQNILILIDSLISKGVTVNSNMLTSSGIAHQRNMEDAILKLINNGYIIKSKVRKKKAYVISFSDTGFKFIEQQNKIFRLLIKNYFHS